MKTQTQHFKPIDLAHRCPVCECIVVRPAAIEAGRWYCRRHADRVPPDENVLAIREAVVDCVDCAHFTQCRKWIDDVCFN